MLYRWPKPFLSGGNLALILDNSSDARQAIIKRALKEESLIRLRRDLYLIKDRQESTPVDSFILAGIIYGPSYISLESALGFHGWIPESVPVTTSAASKRSKEFETPIGTFAYSHIPIAAFSIGLGQYPRQDGVVFIADPWKAIADLIYVQGKSWETMDEVCADMRIEFDKIDQSDLQLLHYLSEYYPSRKVQTTLKKVIKNGRRCY